ncbi:DUF2304 domain-containing protein [Paenibacillus sp. WLX2291]|uniref:DUF2304 domain-containing protein n=1 Tax=Paenibacillus sp. WLX2291 TaxID=3296934 RepID=UPI0039844A51
MIEFLISMVTIAFSVYLVLAIRSKRKGFPKAKKQFRIMWILLASLILLMIINPNKGQSTRSAQNEQPATKQETIQTEPEKANTASTDNKTNASKGIEKNSEPMNKTKTDEEAAIKKETKVVEKEEAKSSGSIGMTATEFRKSFNEKSSGLGADLKISEVNVETGAVQNTFTHIFSDDLVLLGSVNKSDGSIREISLITQAKTSSSAQDFLLTFGIIVLATNPDSGSNAAKIVGEQLGIFKDDVDFSTLDTSTVYNGIEYKMKAYEGMGLMLFVSDPNDK